MGTVEPSGALVVEPFGCGGDGGGDGVTAYRDELCFEDRRQRLFVMGLAMFFIAACAVSMRVSGTFGTEISVGMTAPLSSVSVRWWAVSRFLPGALFSQACGCA